MKKVKKRILSLMLATCLISAMMPAAVFAAETDAGKAIQLGTSGISGFESTKNYDYIYFGNWEVQGTHTSSGPIKWRVLDDQTNTGGTGLFLLSDALLGTGYDGGVYFNNTGNDSNAWQDSTAKTWCNEFYGNSFSEGEQNAVLATTKSDAGFISSSSTYNLSFTESQNILNGDKVFFLSAEEAETSAYGFANDNARIADYGNSAGVWWLRSPRAFIGNGDDAGVVLENGSVYFYYVDREWAVRPAFNLDLNSVLFTSAAVNGKSADTLGTLSAVPEHTGSDWKLTLLDDSRNSFTADVNGQTSASAGAGCSIEVSYSGAQTGNNEYVSALLCDSNDNVLYYGNIAKDKASGKATLNIPSGLATGSYKLKVFSEQCNGDKMTDYASKFTDILLTIQKEPIPTATFTATDDNGGTLSNVEIGMRYSTDGDANWKNITGTPMEITDVTAENDVKVYKPGDGTTIGDSDIQTIDITQPDEPEVSGVDCTTTAQNNGQITGVNDTMEYRLSTATD